MARRRSTVARHARLRSPSPLRQLLSLLAVAALVVLAGVGGTVAYATYDLAASLVDGAVTLEDDLVVPPDIGQIEGGVNLVVTGIDECEPQYAHYFPGRCEGPDSYSKLNDVNMLLHISDSPRRVTVVSFPRDLILDAAPCTREDGTRWGGGTVQINQLYEIGGLPCVVSTISKLSGQPVPFAATVTFGGVIEITDAIGGVDVCLARGIRDPNTGIDWPAGTHTISGIDALQFLRTRYGVGDGSDLGRVSNQQQYMSRLARKLVSDEVLGNAATLYRLASSALRSVTPNDRLTNPVTLVQIALAVKDVPFDDIVFVQYPSLTAPSDASRVVPNYSAAEPLWDALTENRALELTGDVGLNGAVIEVTPDDGTATPDATGDPSAPVEPDAPDQPDAPVEPDPAASPGPDRAVLPPSISGSTAAQETCSAGNRPR